MTTEEAEKWAILFAAYSNGQNISTVGLNVPDFEDLFVVDSGDHDARPDDFKIDSNVIEFSNVEDEIHQKVKKENEQWGKYAEKINEERLEELRNKNTKLENKIEKQKKKSVNFPKFVEYRG